MASWFRDTLFRRVYKNAGFLLSGKAMTGLFGLGYLVLAARGLGLEQFGILVLIKTYLAVFSDVSSFQAWQAVIRYGADCEQRDDTKGFQSLISFTTVLDVLGSMAGAVLAILMAPIIGPYLGWDEQAITYAQWASAMLVLTMTATPTGLLRLYDRFDLLAIQILIKPGLRLVGAAIAFALGLPLWAYVLNWVVGGGIGAIVIFWMGWHEGRKHGRLDNMSWSLKGVQHTHPGIWRFSIAASLQANFLVVTNYLSTLLVGFAADAQAAGLYKIARDVATALTAPAEQLTQSVYPELAKLAARKEQSEFVRLITRASAFAAAVAVCILVLMSLLGQGLISLMFGAEYLGAYACLMLLFAAAVFTVAEFPLTPALNALGKPGIPLAIMAGVMSVLYLPLVYFGASAYGATGAGAAMLAATATTFVLLVGATALQMRLAKS